MSKANSSLPNSLPNSELSTATNSTSANPQAAETTPSNSEPMDTAQVDTNQLENPAAQDTAIPPKRRRLRLVLLILVPLLLTIIGLIFYLSGGRYVETDNAYVKADKVPISTQVSGAVARVLVRENEQVSAGQLLFTLDPAQLEVEQAQADAKLAQVVTNLTALNANYGEKQAELELANSQLVYAKKQEARQANLSAKNYTSAANLDDARQTSKMAALRITAIQQEMASIRANLAGGPEQPLEAHPLYNSALADLNLAKLNLARGEVRAPAPGVVSKLPKVGQYLNTGTIAMMLLETGSPWVEANFTENDITYMHAGLPVSVTIDAYPGYKWSGTVNSLSPGTGAEFSVIPAQNATGNWVKITQRVPVRIQLDANQDAPPLRAGLSANVEVDTEQKTRLATLWPF